MRVRSSQVKANGGKKEEYEQLYRVTDTRVWLTKECG